MSATFKLLSSAKAEIRCSYCGTQHRFFIRVYENLKNGLHVTVLEPENESCDVMYVIDDEVVQ